MCKETLADLAKGQQPFATILGCSDSRVPPELIFDANFGELFIVRVAGNVISPEVMGSLQYAGAHLRTPLFVVLGHEGCGAVKAALEHKFGATEHRSRIQNLVDNILPGLADDRVRKSPGGTTERGGRSQRSLNFYPAPCSGGNQRCLIAYSTSSALLLVFSISIIRYL